MTLSVQGHYTADRKFIQYNRNVIITFKPWNIIGFFFTGSSDRFCNE